ncbi:hypothetical protein KKB43_06605 [Patescibacteria group bacterium]|nr:hypothetical protein [Patescibacteria group bacterium]MBU4580650.1 hypothetical protein [Patescibacteria group bacterium]
MNPITNPKNNKFIRIISLIAISIGTFIVIVFLISSKVFPDIRFFDLLFVPVELRTPIDHEKSLGVEIDNFSFLKARKLDSMITESIKAQLEYYSTEKDEDLDKVKDLYLPEAFEKYKEDVKRENITAKETQKYYKDEKIKFGTGMQSYDKIGRIRFSSLRTYKGVPDRIGVMNLVVFKGGNINNLTQLFIFKNVNGEWKIEKQSEMIESTGIVEDYLIQQIKDGK